MPLSAKEKISMFCQVEKDHVNLKQILCGTILILSFRLKVICMPDVKTLYRVPLILEENSVFDFLTTRLSLTEKKNYDQSFMIKWRDLIER